VANTQPPRAAAALALALHQRGSLSR
jgi:hypothetical protein